jgi:hypothetical protein
MVKKASAVWVVVVLHLVAACAPAAPTPAPTPEATPTPVWVPATKPEHLAGVWYNPSGDLWAVLDAHMRFEADGTILSAPSAQELKETPLVAGQLWFEDGVAYLESADCIAIGSYRLYLGIEGGRAVVLRFEEIDDRDEDCWERSRMMLSRFVRVD